MNNRLIVGLGNPGANYAGTRHNAGFLLIDRLVEKLGAKSLTSSGPLLLWEGHHEGVRVFLMKPLTYMNLSGRALVSFLEQRPMTTEHVLVAYDDVALPLGRLRARPGGSSGGQKGIQHIIETLQTAEIPRLRIGIHGATRAGLSLPEFVLREFDDEEVPLVRTVLDLARDACLLWLEEGLTEVMAHYNSRPASQPQQLETTVSDKEENVE